MKAVICNISFSEIVIVELKFFASMTEANWIIDSSFMHFLGKAVQRLWSKFTLSAMLNIGNGYFRSVIICTCMLIQMLADILRYF